MEILDQEADLKIVSIKKSKLLNSIVILLLLLFLLYTTIRVFSDYFYDQSDHKLLLPSYAFVYARNGLINSAIILLFGLLPLIYFRFRGKYFLSSCCAFSFALIALMLKDTVELYKVFYYFI